MQDRDLNLMELSLEALEQVSAGITITPVKNQLAKAIKSSTRMSGWVYDEKKQEMYWVD